MISSIRPPERQDRIQLRDGRRLAWSEWGPPSGDPVLFCTGAAMSGWLGFGAHDLADLGLTLIAFDRPGLGASEPDHEKTLSSWTEDIAQFIHAQGVHQALAVGFSQGAPFALALGHAQLVKGVAVASGQDELAHPSVTRLLHPDIAHMVQSAVQDPAAFEQRFAEITTMNALWHLIASMASEHDRAFYMQPGFREPFQRSMQEGFAQGAQGYARDLVNTFTRWPFELEQINVPVDLWYGLLDASTVHSPDFGVTMAARLPHASRVQDPAEGGSILWTRSRDILSKLKSHL